MLYIYIYTGVSEKHNSVPEVVALGLEGISSYYLSDLSMKM